MITKSRYSAEPGPPQNQVIPQNRVIPQNEVIPQNRGVPQNQVIPQSPDIMHFLYSACVPQSAVIANYKLPPNTKLQFDTSYHYQDLGNFMFSLSSE